MTLNKTLFIVLLFNMVSLATFAQINKPATNYINVGGPILFDKQSFFLDWSSHPASNFYKQEYILKSDVTGKYKTMLLMDVTTGGVNIKDIIGAKISELKKLKEGNPIVNYEIFDNQKAGEYMIDFLLSANTPGGKDISTIERNVYRYKAFTDAAGHTGILLFGVSTRGYGDGVNAFLSSLKTNKKDLVNKVAQFKTPSININK